MENSEVKEEEKKEELVQETPVTILESELDALKAEAQEFKDKYWLLLAESENARKRLQKEKQELTQFALQNFILEILPPIDQFGQALSFADQMSDEVRNWAKGFDMIRTQLADSLASQGVRAFESKGKLFDPNYHEALDSVETDEIPPGTIIEEMVRGYMIADRLLRPARVKVAKAIKVAEEELQEEEKTKEGESENDE